VQETGVSGFRMNFAAWLCLLWNMLATAGNISAIDCYEGVLLVVCWPIWVSFVGDLLAYLSEFCWWFVGLSVSHVGDLLAYLSEFHWWFVGLSEWVLLVICWPISMFILLAVLVLATQLGG